MNFLNFFKSNKNKIENLKKEKSQELFAYATVSFRTENFKDALEYINKDLCLYSDSWESLRLKSEILGSLKEYKESLKCSLKSYEIFNKIYGNKFILNNKFKVHHHLVIHYGDLISSIAISYINIEEYEKAIPFLEEEINIFSDPDTDDYKTPFNSLVFCQQKLKNKEEFINYFMNLENQQQKSKETKYSLRYFENLEVQEITKNMLNNKTYFIH